MVRPVIRVPYEVDEHAGGAAPLSFGALVSSERSSGGTGGGGGPTPGGGSAPRKPFSKVPSLLFEIEDMEDGTNHKPRGEEAGCDASLLTLLSSLGSLLEPWSEAEYMLLVHVRLAREDAARRSSAPLTVPDLADTLRRLGYCVKIRTALGGGYGGTCLRNLRHQFLTIDLTAQGGTSQAHYILDPQFREQFEVAHPTPRYGRVMEALGQEVLATPDRLTKVVELMCHEMARCFQETGTSLPPWRQLAAMLSKWQPRRSEDTDVLPCPASFFNNALGMMSPAPAGSGDAGLRPPPQGHTVAQWMAARPPVPKPLGPSPIPEGVESGSPRTTLDSSAGSFEAGWYEAGEAAAEGGEEAAGPASPAAAAAQILPLPPLPPPARLAADMLGAAQRARRQSSGPLPPVAHLRPKPMHVWEGMQRAAAELPRQRYSWA